MMPKAACNIKNKRRIIFGAAFLSAISAFGPSLMTQVAVFSEEYGSAFVWTILLTGIINIIILCSAWLLITGKGKTVTELADDLFQGYGTVLSLLFAFCCVCFNIGNICGIVSGMGLLFSTSSEGYALMAGALCLLFVLSPKGKAIDIVVSVFAFSIIAVLVYTLSLRFSKGSGLPAVSSSADSVSDLFVPGICMLFGSYIPFIGGQSLHSQGIEGKETFHTVLFAAIASASVTLVMRLLMSLSDLAVISRFGSLGESNPSAAVFLALPGSGGKIIFAIMQIIISISCVYATTSCFNTFSSHFSKKAVGRKEDILLTALCTAVAFFWGRPERLMVIAGIVSGMLTPLSLIVLLITGSRKNADGKRNLPITFTATLGLVFILTVISVIDSIIK